MCGQNIISIDHKANRALLHDYRSILIFLSLKFLKSHPTEMNFGVVLSQNRDIFLLLPPFANTVQSSKERYYKWFTTEDVISRAYSSAEDQERRQVLTCFRRQWEAMTGTSERAVGEMT